MAQKDTYKLEFKVATADSNWQFYICTRHPQSSMHPMITNIMACLGKQDTEEFIQQLDYAIAKSSSFDADTQFDSTELEYVFSDEAMPTIPTHVRIGNEMLLPLDTFKQLLQEWLVFMNQNPIKRTTIKF